MSVGAPTPARRWLSNVAGTSFRLPLARTPMPRGSSSRIWEFCSSRTTTTSSPAFRGRASRPSDRRLTDRLAAPPGWPFSWGGEFGGRDGTAPSLWRTASPRRFPWWPIGSAMAQSRRQIRGLDFFLELFEQQALLVVGAVAPSRFERKSVRDPWGDRSRPIGLGLPTEAVEGQEHGCVHALVVQPDAGSCRSAFEERRPSGMGGGGKDDSSTALLTRRGNCSHESVVSPRTQGVGTARTGREHCRISFEGGNDDGNCSGSGQRRVRAASERFHQGWRARH